MRDGRRKSNAGDIVKVAKRSQPFLVVDSHFHPIDVYLPAFSIELNQKDRSTHNNKLGQENGLAEVLDYGPGYILLVKLLTRILPSLVVNSVLRCYAPDVDDLELDHFFESIGIDRVVLVPVAPYSTALSFQKYRSERFIYFGSVDVNSNAVISDLDVQAREMNISGIKLHPNLQQFHPVPSKNSEKISKNLESIYHYASENSLPIMFHAGRTNFLKRGYKQYSVLENFYVSKSRTIFSEYNFSPIIAHLGGYAEIRANIEGVAKLIRMNEGALVFDTSGMSSQQILRFLKNFGPDYFVFGSDGLYNNVQHSYDSCVKAIHHYSPVNSLELNLSKVLSTNFLNRIAR